MTDTIAAIATARGEAGIGILRISGPDACDIGSALLGGRNLNRESGGRFFLGHLRPERETLDEVIVLVFRSPHSYTGEDVVELQCHGGDQVLSVALREAIGRGARLAQPGEFTQRAFLNGRLDLSQAEAVMDLIASSSDQMLKNASKGLAGIWSGEIRSLRAQILSVMAYLEAALDDPEHFDLSGYQGTFLEAVRSWRQRISERILSARDGIRLRAGIPTVLCGLPNVGKSSLMNTLAGSARAIVTDIPGTTRDRIEERVVVGGIPLILTDTAGLRDTQDPVERIGVSVAREALEEAQLVLMVLDASRPVLEEEVSLAVSLSDRPLVLVANKSDLPRHADLSQLQERIKIRPVFVSAKTGEGLDTLREVIAEEAGLRSVLNTETYYVTHSRQLAALEEAEKSLSMAEESASDGMPEEVWIVDLTDAYAALGRILGETVDEDVINAVFASFCMGK